LSRGHGTAHRRLHIQPKQQQQQQLQHYSQQQHYRGAKTLYSNGRHNPHEVSPSSFRYYSSSVEYLADNNGGPLNKSSPDSGYPGDVANGCDLYENLPFHGMANKQPPHKQQAKNKSHQAGQQESNGALQDENLIYADSDYRDLYAYGPVSYTQTSRIAAQTKKEELAKRYGAVGRH